MKLLLIVPEGWEIEKIRYVHRPTERAYLVDLDLIDTPLDDPDSVLNFKQYVLKENGPTGYVL